ncbi:hypothetical protein PGIGA_G00111380 [Pangasianodon gigas]|uniref:Uncharacterized protein n=1 Tax=Pangasianodon gigas TaxID=30993 RepID=A0ACC5W9E2_PANGG|nr:hypothetical protein [Pangasianodon gigas]
MVNDCPPRNTNDYTVEWWEFTQSSIIFTGSGADRGRAREIFNVLWVTASEAAEHVSLTDIKTEEAVVRVGLQWWSEHSREYEVVRLNLEGRRKATVRKAVYREAESD